MRYLTGSAWEQFIRKGRTPVAFDGDAFEALVRILLKDFPGRWEATPRTRDGGKDVVDRSIPSEIVWAECKMYRAPLSLQVVSNTLVMAIIETNVRRILFFSYSDVTQNAKHYLACYGTLTGKTVQVYDGELLEALILRSSEAMQRYFPSFLAAAQGYRHPREQALVLPYFSLDVHVRHHQLAHVQNGARPREHHVPLNAPCMYELVFIAQHIDGVQCIRLELGQQQFSDFVVLNAEQVAGYQQLSLSAGQTLSLPIYLVPLVSGTVTIPPIAVHSDAWPPFSLLPVPLRVSAFERPLLVGKFVREALIELDMLVSSGSVNQVYATSGRSGVGKSRFLDEAVMRLIRNGYEIHYFDGTYVQAEPAGRDDATGHALPAQLIRSLLCSLWRLPDPVSLRDTGEPGEPNGGVPLGEFGPVSQMVYEWDAQRLMAEPEAIADLIIQGYGSRRNALIIDNVQTYPEPVIAILDRVVQRIAGTLGQSFFLLAFNEDDLVFNTAATVWLRTLNANRNHAIRHLPLPEFSRATAVEFINNLFQERDDRDSYSDTHPETLDLILQKVLLRPLDLWQLAKGLEDRGAIRVGRSAFTIVDFVEFNRALQELHPDREALLNWRLQRLCATPGLDGVLTAITYLGPLGWHELESLAIAGTSCQMLIQASVLRENREQKLEFYHPSLTRYFNRHSRDDKLFPAVAKQRLYLCAQTMEQYTSRARWFGLAYDVGADLAPLLSACSAEFIGLDNSGASPLHLAADRLLAYVRARENVQHWWPVLPALAGAAHIAAQGATAVLPARTAYLYDMASRIATACPPGGETLRSWTHIVREMAGYVAVDEHTGEQADQVLRSALHSLDQATGTADQQALALARAHLLNRRCVTLKRRHRHADARDEALKSCDLAQAHGLVDLVCLNWVDIGYLDYGLAERNAQLCASWNTAAAAFEDRHPNLGRHVHDIHLIMGLVGGNLDCLADRFKQAEQHFDRLIRASRDRAHSFYQLQGMAAKATMLLRQALLEPSLAELNCSLALDVARGLEDIAGSMLDERRYRSALYLQGKALELAGQRDDAVERYKAALAVPVRHEEAALQYDLGRLLGRRPALPPTASTFSVADVYLPLP